MSYCATIGTAPLPGLLTSAMQSNLPPATLSYPPLVIPSSLKLAASDSGLPPLALSQPYPSGLILFGVLQSCWPRPRLNAKLDKVR